LKPIFSKNRSTTYIQNFRDERGSQSLSTAGAIFTFNNQKLRDNKKDIFSLWGAWPPNLTLEPHVPRNLSRALQWAQEPEKISEIARTVAEKIEFEKKFGTPWRPNRKWAWSRDLIYRMRLMGTIIPENIKTLGLELTTLLEFFNIAFGPINGM